MYRFMSAAGCCSSSCRSGSNGGLGCRHAYVPAALAAGRGDRGQWSRSIFSFKRGDYRCPLFIGEVVHPCASEASFGFVRVRIELYLVEFAEVLPGKGDGAVAGA
jgi:hypothetical protein